jgi:hypothetical protein
MLMGSVAPVVVVVIIYMIFFEEKKCFTIHRGVERLLL